MLEKKTDIDHDHCPLKSSTYIHYERPSLLHVIVHTQYRQYTLLLT